MLMMKKIDQSPKRSKLLLLQFLLFMIPLNPFCQRAYEAVRRVALSRKVHSGYQFLVLVEKDIIEQIVPTTFTPPFLFVWEHHTGYYFIYNVFTFTCTH